MTQRDCEHRGTVWHIDIIGGQPDPDAATWECTRCGERWTEAPGDLVPRLPLQNRRRLQHHEDATRRP